MSTEICMHCDKKFNNNDGFSDERMITCINCLKDHFVTTTETEKMLKKLLKQKRKEAK